MLACLDEAVGNITNALKRHGMWGGSGSDAGASASGNTSQHTGQHMGQHMGPTE